MTRLPKLPFFTVTLLFTFVSPASPQGIYDVEGTWFDLPGIVPTTGFTRTIDAELNGDYLRELVFLAGSEPFIMFGPDLYNSVVPLDAARGLRAHDIDVLPGEGPAGTDVIVTVSDVGLELWRLGPGTQLFTRQSLGSEDFHGAKQMRLVDLDEDKDLDFVGLTESGRRVKVLWNDGAGHTEDTLVDHHTPFDRIELIQWDGATGLEVAAMTVNGDLHVFDLGGGVDSFVGASVAMEVVNRHGTKKQRLAWIVRTATGQYLNVIGDGVVEPGVPFGPLGGVALRAADLEGDGDDELAVSHTFNGDQLIYGNVSEQAEVPADPSFVPGVGLIAQVAPYGVDFSQSRAWPCFGDFDEDGDDDLAFPIFAEQQVVLFRSAATAQEVYHCPVGGTSILREVEDTHGNISHELDFEVFAPAEVPQAATHVQVVVWRHPFGSPHVDHHAVSNDRYGLEAWPLKCTVGFPEQNASFKSRYYIEVRLVAEEGGVVDAAWAGVIFTYFGDLADMADYLVDNEESQQTTSTLLEDGPPVGGVVSVPPLCPFCPGQVPCPLGTP